MAAAQVQMSTRVDVHLKKAVTAYCRAHGLKIGRFVENALLDKLEELEDASELERLRKEPSRPFQEFVRELKARGRL
ncbi:MAG: hypothetical protein ACOZIN_20685 [Myxococcota bacterium]